MLSDFLHSLPHINCNLQRVSNDFAVDSDYFVSIGMIAAPFAFAAFLSIFVTCLFLCARCCCCHPSIRDRLRFGRHPFSYYVIFGASIVLMIGAVVYGILENSVCANGFDSILHAAKSMNSSLATSVGAAESIVTSLEAVHNNVDVYQANSRGLPSQQVIDLQVYFLGESFLVA